MKNTMKKYLLGIFLFLGTIFITAQRVPPPQPQPQSGDIGGPATPIDGYIGYLIAIAVILIIYLNKKILKTVKN